jgi:hypothetical protein
MAEKISITSQLLHLKKQANKIIMIEHNLKLLLSAVLNIKIQHCVEDRLNFHLSNDGLCFLCGTNRILQLLRGDSVSKV